MTAGRAAGGIDGSACGRSDGSVSDSGRRRCGPAVSSCMALRAIWQEAGKRIWPRDLQWEVLGHRVRKLPGNDPRQRKLQSSTRMVERAPRLTRLDGHQVRSELFVRTSCLHQNRSHSAQIQRRNCAVKLCGTRGALAVLVAVSKPRVTLRCSRRRIQRHHLSAASSFYWWRWLSIGGGGISSANYATIGKLDVGRGVCKPCAGHRGQARSITRPKSRTMSLGAAVLATVPGCQ
jgi:hypothetical protein